MSDHVEELLQLAELGYKAAIVSTRHLLELQEEIKGHTKHGLLDKEFFQERLSWFKFTLPENMVEAKSLIVVAVPRPHTQATFTWNGHLRHFMIPPTYTAYDETRNRVEEVLSEVLGKKGYEVARAALPLKLLAARSGLAKYGRNNICYVPKMGSFLQIVAVYSDKPCEKDQWQEAEMMTSCQNCQICRKACPTNAIPSDRFLLRAERCIVYHNERKGGIPFPEWMKPSWHNCVVGCLHCQRTCPENTSFLKWIGDKEEFSEEETDLLMKGTHLDELPSSTTAKLKHLSLIDYLENLPRNLAVLLK